MRPIKPACHRDVVLAGISPEAIAQVQPVLSKPKRLRPVVGFGAGAATSVVAGFFAQITSRALKMKRAECGHRSDDCEISNTSNTVSKDNDLSLRIPRWM